MRLKFIIFCAIFIVFGPCLKAQDYIYSVSLDPKWGSAAFAELELQQRELSNNADLKDAPKFSGIFSQYQSNFQSFNNYNDSIFFEMPHEEWIKMFQRRARFYTKIYKQNNNELNEIKAYFKKKNIPEAAYDSLYYWSSYLLFKNVNDVFLQEDLVNIMLPHYQSNGDDEHLVLCYFLLGNCFYNSFLLGEAGSEQKSLDYYRKVLAFSDKFTEFKNPLNRYYLVSSYANIFVLHSQVGTLSLNESLDLSQQMQNLYEMPESKDILDQDENLKAYTKWSIDIFGLRGILSYYSRGIDDQKVLDALYAKYTAVKEEQGILSSKEDYYAKLNYDDCLIDAFLGKSTWDNAWSRFKLLMKSDPDFIIKTEKPKVNALTLFNFFQTFLTVIEQTSLSDNEKGKEIKEMVDYVHDMLAKYDHSTNHIEMGNIVTKIVTNKIVLKYSSAEERKENLNRFLVVQQPTTYVHVSMVADLSRLLAEAMVEYRPGFFIGVPGYKTTKDVLNNKEELIEYVYQSAVYHDLGKIYMPTIIINNFRRLTDHEFGIVKLHSELSKYFFEIEPSIMKYQDIAFGHHKWYNDIGGYPASFKIRKSPYFPIICLVSMCDSMDAATENISRNYHTAKSFEKLIRECDAAGAAQYHAALLKFLNTHPETYKQMKECVNEGRYENYVKLYREYMTH